MKNLRKGQRVFWLYMTPDDEIIFHEREVQSIDTERYGLIKPGEADRGINFVSHKNVFPSYKEALERFEKIIEEQGKRIKDMEVIRDLNRSRFNQITQSIEDYTRRNEMKI